MENKILAIDPSGTGTTGIFFKSNSEEQFISYQDPDWKKHYDFIADMVKVYHPDILLYETTNFISLRGKDMTSLLKLLGSLETLSLPCSSLRIEAIPVNQVKELRNKLLKGEQKIEDLEYRSGKGWHHNGKKISVHGLDAYLVYWIWESKTNSQPKNELIGKSIEADKMKQKTSQNNKTTCDYCDKEVCVCWVKYHNRNKEIDIKEELPDIDDLPWELKLPEDDITFCPESEPEPTCPECGCYECVCEKETEESEETEDKEND